MPIACPFCDPAILAAIYAETERCRAIYNRAPLVDGHSLIVPKRHATRLGDLSPGEWTELFGLARRMALLLMPAYGCDGYDLSLQEGASAGQTMAHLHLHIVPRRPGDLPHDDWHAQLLDSALRRRLSPDEMARHVARLRAMGGAAGGRATPPPAP
jgi:bis(5'-adenosyl)-triphosphatase